MIALWIETENATEDSDNELIDRYEELQKRCEDVLRRIRKRKERRRIELSLTH